MVQQLPLPPGFHMTTLDTTSAIHVPLDRLAEGFGACFSEYMVPIASDIHSFEQRVRHDHIHLTDSHVVLRDGRLVALALVARRGDLSRMAALGVVPPLRRSGLGRALTQRLLEEARSRGDRAMHLEVIEQNTPAVALYADMGFQVRRRLVGWAGTPPEQPAPLEPIPLPTALAALLQHGEPGLPWQLAPETLAGHTAPTQAWRLGEAVAVVTSTSPQEVVLRALVVPEAQRRRGVGSRLLRALAAHLPGRRLRVLATLPEELGSGFLAANGLQRQALTQLEMVWTP